MGGHEAPPGRRHVPHAARSLLEGRQVRLLRRRVEPVPATRCEPLRSSLAFGTSYPAQSFQIDGIAELPSAPTKWPAISMPTDAGAIEVATLPVHGHKVVWSEAESRMIRSWTIEAHATPGNLIRADCARGVRNLPGMACGDTIQSTHPARPGFVANCIFLRPSRLLS